MTQPRTVPTGTGPMSEPRGVIVWALAGVAAVGTVLAGAEPTASPVTDVLVNGAVTVLVVVLSSRASPWTWVLMAGVAAAGADGPGPTLAGVTALVGAFAAIAFDRHDRFIGAAVGALAVQGLFRLPGWEPQGLATAMAVAAVVPVLVSGFRRSEATVRRRLAVGAVVATVVALACSALAVVVAVGQRSTLQEGIDRARAGLRAAEAGDTGEATTLLREAERAFGDSADALGAPWMAPAAAVPVVGQNVDALAVAAEQGTELAATAADALVDADLEELRFDDGVLDLEQVASFGPPLDRSATALHAALDDLAAVNSSWLLPPVGDRYRTFSAELTDAAADAEVAVEAVALAPALFGGEGDRRYLILFTTPAEMRGLGGFVGNYGELTAVDGDVELTRSGRVNDVKPAVGAPPWTITGPADYVERWGRYEVGRYVQDTTYSPDFPSVAQVWEEMYPQMPGGGAVDGVIVVDPYALAALMTFTGPIVVPGYDTPLTSENAADILLREQYLTFAQDNEQRIDFLDDVTRLTFEALTTGDLPGPREVTEVLGPMVAQGRLLVHSVTPGEQDFFTGIDLDGALPEVDGDFLSVTTQNSGNNKIDIFLHRRIRYDVRYDPDTGRVEADVTVTLRNDAPASGLPNYVIGNRDTTRIPPGANQMYLSVYTPWDIVDATLGGRPIPVEHAEELDRFAYAHHRAGPLRRNEDARVPPPRLH